jgi:hypothetical protein
MFEKTCARKLKGCDYEPKDAELHYVVSKVYHPDFVPSSRTGIIFECKGRFRTSYEASKYIAVRECNPNIQIIFIFQSPQTPMPNARVRKKCGTKQSHAEWAEKNNFLWCTKDTIKKEWLK